MAELTIPQTSLSLGEPLPSLRVFPRGHRSAALVRVCASSDFLFIWFICFPVHIPVSSAEECSCPFPALSSSYSALVEPKLSQQNQSVLV